MPILGANSSSGSRPSAPVIGSATDGGTGTTASIAFTPSTYIGKSTIAYTATSSPGSITATSSSSPITVTGLTTGTAYTFTVQGTTNYGTASAVSSASNSVTPANPSSFESIATAIGNSSSATITFNSIPSTFKHLQLRMTLKNAGTSGSAGGFDIRFNSDSSYIYTYHYIAGDGTSLTTTGQSNTNKIDSINGVLPDNYSGSGFDNMVGVSILDIQDYASTTKFKTARSFSGFNSSGVGAESVGFSSGLWRDTSAITSISIISASANAWTSKAQFSLYGIKGA